MAVTLTLNGAPATFEDDPATPLLWVIRDRAKLTGTKFGCGVGACGACTVHVNGVAVRSCMMPIASLTGATVVTIEGLAASGGLAAGAHHPLQQAWIDAQVPQCGYCQSGMLMAAAALLGSEPQPSDEAIDRAMTNLCRCGTYPRVRRAIHLAAARQAAAGPGETA